MRFLAALTVAALAAAPTFAYGAPAAYSLYSGTIRGDVRIVGMGGATTALPDDYFGAVNNPAGPALTLKGIDLQLTGSGIEDHLQTNPGTSVTAVTTGVAMLFSDFGASIGTAVPFEAISPSLEDIYLREYRPTISAAFFDHRLAIGFGLAFEVLNETESSLSGLRTSFGALYRFPKRILVGLSYSPSLLMGPDAQGRYFSLPHDASIGVAWIPNRSFRGGVALHWLAAEQDTVRFHDPSEIVGATPAMQVHAGFSYELLSFRKTEALVYSGTYLESTRSVEGSRLHYTAGFELTPWLLDASVGLDVASGYRNIMGSIGLNVAAILRGVHVMPASVPPPPAGALPRPFEVSDDWLPEQLMDSPDDAFKAIGPELDDYRRSIKNLPRNIDKPSVGDDLKGLFEE